MTHRLYGSRWHAAALGLVAAGAGLAAGELVVGLVEGSASPVVPVGQLVIDRAPGGVREWAIETFGTADKAVLLTGSLLTLALVGCGVGLLAIRGHRSGAFALAGLVGLIGAAAVIERPAPSLGKLLPTLVGTAVSIGAVWWLTPDGGRDGVERPPPRREPRAVDVARFGRRHVVEGLVTVGAGALIAAVLGRVLQRRFSVSDERAGLELPQPDAAAAPVPVEPDPATPFVTPNDDFYRIDTALVVPQVSVSEWSLRIHGMVDRELTIDFDDLLARDQVERYVTLACVSNNVGGELVGNARWQGVLLADLLAEAGVRPDAEQLVSTSADGWTCGSPVAAVLDGRDAMLAVGMNGEPLPPEHGYPVRMIIPGLFGYVSATKWVTDIEVTTWDAFDAYWVRVGWAREAPVKTMTRIDRPARRDGWTEGPIDVAGVAWAVHRGISRVEVRVDEGPWRECELEAVPSDDTWRLWRYRWDASAGEHAIEARAFDGDGVVQPAEPMGVIPDGAQGYHRRRVDVDAR